MAAGKKKSNTKIKFNTEEITMKNNQLPETTLRMLEVMQREDKSTLKIEPAIIAEAINNGYLTKIVENRRNVYYEINVYGSDDQILMHVCNDQYVVLSKYTYMADGVTIFETVPAISKYSFCLGRIHNRQFVMSTPIIDKKQRTVYLHRILKSLELYGDIRMLDTTYDIHHRGASFDNRGDMLLYIPRAEHKHSDSHMTGGEIKSLDSFIYLVVKLSNDLENSWSFDHVA